MGYIIQRDWVRARRPRRAIEAMKMDVRAKTICWVVLRREAKNNYHIQGVWVDNDDANGEELAANTCNDDTYWIVPFPVNMALPESPIEVKGAYRPTVQKRNYPRPSRAEVYPPRASKQVPRGMTICPTDEKKTRTRKRKPKKA